MVIGKNKRASRASKSNFKMRQMRSMGSFDHLDSFGSVCVHRRSLSEIDTSRQLRFGNPSEA